MEETIIEHDIDTEVLRFAGTDRASFFELPDVCYDHGITARMHQARADTVLTATVEPEEPLVDIAIEPWDMQEYVPKRVFDVVFAASRLFALIPVIVMIAMTIKLDSPGPILYQ